MPETPTQQSERNSVLLARVTLRSGQGTREEVPGGEILASNVTSCDRGWRMTIHYLFMFSAITGRQVLN